MKTITLPDGRTLTYVLTRKRVKNVNFRIKPDGVIYISASSRVSVKAIEKILQERADAFFAALSRVEKREQRQCGMISSDKIRWLGKDYPITVIKSSRETALIEQDELRVFTMHDEPEHIRYLAENAVSAAFLRLCEELNGEVRSALISRGLTPPPTRVTIKDMSSRWGSCSYTRGHISINRRLAQFPRETVLSVFWHEYAHYWHHDHSAAFYGFLETHFPEYRKWNNLLK